MATVPKDSGITYEDFVDMFPEVDHVRRELIEGQLVVSPPPSLLHQKVVLRLGIRLDAWCQRNGGEVYIAPTGVLLEDSSFVEPDVLFVSGEHLDRLEEPFVRGAPDLVVEVSSPSTRRVDLIRKRKLYERFQVPEYWFVDLDAERVEVYRLQGSGFGPAIFLGHEESLEPPGLAGFSLSVDELLGPPPKEG